MIRKTYPNSNGPAPNFSITRIYPNSTTNAKRQKPGRIQNENECGIENGESDEFDGYYVQFGRAGSMMHVDFFNEVTTAIRENLPLSAVRKLIMESWFSLMASSHLQWIIAEDTKSRSSIW